MFSPRKTGRLPNHLAGLRIIVNYDRLSESRLGKAWPGVNAEASFLPFQ
jgi:hypothetical protein